jgi:hypothetical protein
MSNTDGDVHDFHIPINPFPTTPVHILAFLSTRLNPHPFHSPYFQPFPIDQLLCTTTFRPRNDNMARTEESHEEK